MSPEVPDPSIRDSLAHRAVLEEPFMPIRSILVPTDFSEHSAAALQLASELARSFSAKIHLMHSYWIHVSLGTSDPFLIPVDFTLEQLEKSISGTGICCEVHLSALPAAAAILEIAKEIPADMIVMGTEGLTGMKHVLLGSVAERIVRLAPCPVLTVKATQGNPEAPERASS
jgi:nucleotide-binding universal stress UspA family protein